MTAIQAMVNQMAGARRTHYMRIEQQAHATSGRPPLISEETRLQICDMLPSYRQCDIVRKLGVTRWQVASVARSLGL